jgi:hypothetical protein
MTHKTDEEIVEEFRSVSQKKVGEGYIGDLPYTDYEYHFTEEQTDWLRTTLKAVREESYQKGYNAGLADGTDKPLLAIEQIREKERYRVLELATKIISNPVEFMQLTVESEITPPK